VSGNTTKGGRKYEEGANFQKYVERIIELGKTLYFSATSAIIDSGKTSKLLKPLCENV
jgi:hypothetical protein